VAGKRRIEGDEVVCGGVVIGETWEEGGAGFGTGATDSEVVGCVLVVMDGGGDVVETDWEQNGCGWLWSGWLWSGWWHDGCSIWG